MDKRTKNKNPEVRFKGFTEDWKEKDLSEIAQFNPKTELPESFQYVDLESVSGTEMTAYRSESKNTAPSRAQRLANKGDVFYQTVRPYQKNNYLFDRVENNFVFSTGYAQMRPFDDSYFLFSLIQGDEFVKIVLDNCTGTSYPAINATILAKIKRYFPKATEQKKIGSFFQNLDNLITLHQKKYDKLLILKKAMLVKLFPKNGAVVPEIRFKGFTEDWEEKKLGEIGQTYTGLSGKTKVDFGHGKGRFVTYMNVFNNPISNLKITDVIEIDNSQNEVNYGDVFFTTSSETPEEVGMSSVWLSNEKNIYLNSFCFGYRLSEKIDSYFLSNLLRSTNFRTKISFLAQGISRYNISKNRVMEILIEIPSYNEQIKIGEYFKNLNSQIALHQTQLDKLKNIKKACFSKMFVSQD